MNATITLKEYLDKKKTFVIPDYQRGYVWGKKREGEKNSVENLLDDLIVRFEGNTDVFLQGFTVTENRNEIIIIDGQQRTTCLYLLLKWLGYDGEFNIQYRIRQESNNFLKALKFDDIGEDKNEFYQDFYFFKKTLRIISSKLENIDKNTKLEKLHFAKRNSRSFEISLNGELFVIYPVVAWDWELEKATLTFTGQGENGSTVWGKKSFSSMTGLYTDTLYYLLDQADPETLRPQYEAKLKKIEANPTQAQINKLCTQLIAALQAQ